MFNRNELVRSTQQFERKIMKLNKTICFFIIIKRKTNLFCVFILNSVEILLQEVRGEKLCILLFDASNKYCIEQNSNVFFFF